MIDYLIIALLILSGIALVVVEIVFVPGTTLVGIFGFLIGGYGIYHSYELYGSEIGHYVLLTSAILGFTAIFYSFKSGVWKKFTLDNVINAKVNEGLTHQIEIGKEGVATSSLKPVGKAEFDDKEYEVRSLGSFVEEKQPIKILKIEQNKIYVEPIT